MYQNHTNSGGKNEDIVDLPEFHQTGQCGQMEMFLLNHLLF